MFVDCRFPEPGKCLAQVWVKDCYRVSRGHGFKMHYNRRQCCRNALDSGYCKQHAKIARECGHIPKPQSVEE